MSYIFVFSIISKTPLFNAVNIFVEIDHRITANEQVFGKVLDKNVRSADGQLLNSCSIAQFLLDCPIMLGLPKLLLKESRFAELLPSASTFLNTFVIASGACRPSLHIIDIIELIRYCHLG